jgi:predicted dehydrogenase
MAKQFKVGVIGLGFIGPAHIEAVRRLGHQVVAVAARTQQQADERAARYHVPRGYGDYQDLVNDPEVEVVHIASPNHLHYPQARAALEAGKHVICEKPLAMNPAEGRELVELARERGLVNAVTFNIRYYPLNQEARALVQAGALGDRIYIVQGSYLQDWLLYETDWNWRLVPELGGDLRAVADIGSHWADLMTYITGTRIVEVFADFETFIPVRQKPTTAIDTFSGKLQTAAETEEQPIHTEDYASVLLKFDNGARGVMTVSQVCSGRKNRLFFEIDGSESSLFWDGEQPNQLVIGHRSQPNEVIIKDPSLMSDEARWAAAYPGGHAEGFPDTFKALSTAVYSYIEASDFTAPPPFPTFEDGLRTLLIDQAVLASAREGRWVAVAY